MELNRDIIVKALECCQLDSDYTCKDCPLKDGDCAIEAGLALALIRELTDEVAKAKADTVLKMRERLKEEAIDIQDHMGEFDVVVLEEDIDRIAEELLEEGK